MKITFLGTSHGVPDADRYCQSILIEAGESAYLVDAGAPVVDLLLRKGFDLKKIKAVFITHMHGDHIDGLLSFLDLSMWYYKETSYDIYVTEETGIACFKNILNMIHRNSMSFPDDRLRFKVVDENFCYDDGIVTVNAVPTKHLSGCDRPAYGYVIEDHSKKIYISGDLSGDEIDYSDIAEKEELDAFMVESAHFDSARLTEKLKSCKAKKVMVIHGYRDEIADDFAELEKTDIPFELIYPSDGDEYII